MERFFVSETFFFVRQQDDVLIRLEGKRIKIHLDACIQVDI